MIAQFSDRVILSFLALGLGFGTALAASGTPVELKVEGSTIGTIVLRFNAPQAIPPVLLPGEGVDDSQDIWIA
jgi:hypothetical protein